MTSLIKVERITVLQRNYPFTLRIVGLMKQRGTESSPGDEGDDFLCLLLLLPCLSPEAVEAAVPDFSLRLLCEEDEVLLGVVSI